MKLRIAVLLLCLWPPTLASSADDIEALFNKALTHLVKNGYTGDTSAPKRYLQAVLEQRPDHLEAQWLLIRIALAGLESMPLSARSTVLSAVGPEFARLAKQAEQAQKQAFLHFIRSRYAEEHNAYERALAEIDKALALEPESPRYLATKARILVSHGSWTKRDEEIEKGIHLLRKAKELAKTNPTPFAREADYDFQIAYSIAELSQPRWQEVVEYYLRYIELSEESVPYAFAWTNLSIAYRSLGECTRAKAAAEKALKVMKFPAAQSQKRYAEFCLEMQRAGLMGK